MFTRWIKSLEEKQINKSAQKAIIDMRMVTFTIRDNQVTEKKPDLLNEMQGSSRLYINQLPATSVLILDELSSLAQRGGVEALQIDFATNKGQHGIKVQLQLSEASEGSSEGNELPFIQELPCTNPISERIRWELINSLRSNQIQKRRHP